MMCFPMRFKPVVRSTASVIVVSVLLLFSIASTAGAEGSGSRGAENIFGAMDVTKPRLRKFKKDYSAMHRVQLDPAPEKDADSGQEPTVAHKPAGKRTNLTTTHVGSEAPKSFKDMFESYKKGDWDGARSGADNYVEYMVNLVFDTRQITSLIMESLIAKGLIDEESARGITQLSNWMKASERKSTRNAFRPSHDMALKRVVADRKAKAEVYFFFAHNCQYCREMAPDVERLYRATKNDKRVSVKALALGNPPTSWTDQFKKYSGLSMPVYNGDDAAKELRISMLPALVVISPTQKVSYQKTGRLSFERMYELVRTVQGLPYKETKALVKLKNTPIGFIERKQKGVLMARGKRSPGVSSPAANPRLPQVKLQKF